MSKSKKPFFQTISAILVILMLISLPIPVVAEDDVNIKKESAVSFDNLSTSECDDSVIVSEIKSRRDKYTKHFRMDDGTIMAITYDYPIHFKNDNGKWIEYDNSLVSVTSATPDEAEVVESYTNKKSDLNINIASDTRSSTMVNISSKHGNISWNYLNNKKSLANVNNTEQTQRKSGQKDTLDRKFSTINFKSLYQNVDLDTIVTTTGVKENIILKNSDVNNEFEIEYDIGELKAKQVDEQTIELSSKNGKIAYVVSAPCMYDAKGSFSGNVSLNIVKIKNNKLLVKLIVDKEFITSNERLFPITIDPEVSINGYSYTETAEVDNTVPDTVRGQSTHFHVGSQYAGLIKLKNIQENYADKHIVSAKVKLFPMNQSSEMEIEAHPITSSWTNSTATFNNVSYDSEVIDYVKTRAGSTDVVSLDLTKYVRKWANDTAVNNGVYLKSTNAATNFGGYACYISGKKPTFVVKYKDYVGLESNLTSHSVPCGQDAVFSVCDYTGSLSVKQSFFEETTERLPLSIYATYHSVRNTTNEHTGYGWHYSFNQTVNEDDNYYIYKDAEGINRYFKKDDNLDTLTDEDDEYTLTYDSTNNKIEIDDEDITKTFEIVDNTDTYRLTLDKSNENSNNTIEYFYNNSGYMNRIHTSLGDYSINRTSDHYITSISTPNTKSMTFVYYSNSSKIARFKAVDGKSSRFTYTTNADEGLLNEVKYSTNSVFGGKVCCSYNQNNKISQIIEYGKNDASRNTLTVTYNNDNTTEFTDKNGNKETYTFDNYGNTVSVLNANGSITNADGGGLSINSGSDSYTKNYLSEPDEPSSIGNVYSTASGSVAQHSGTIGTASIDDEKHYLGNKSIKIYNNPDVSSQIHTYVKQEIDIDNWTDESVTLSAYVKTEDTNGIYSGISPGAYVEIICKSESGAVNARASSVPLTTSDKGFSWERLSATVTIPSNTDKIVACFGLKNTYGSAWFDCMQLEKGDSVNDYNALSNSDFSSASDWKDQNGNAIALNNDKVTLNGLGGEPAQVVETESEDESEPESEYITDETYMVTETETFENDVIEETDTYGHIVSAKQGFVTRTYSRTYGIEPTEETEESTEDTTGTSGNDDEEEDEEISAASITYIYQEVPVNAQDVAFKISGTAKAQSVPLNNDYRTFGIALKIKYDNDDEYTETHYQEFNAYTDSFQNVALSVTPDDSEKVVESVAFAFVYDYNKNTMEVKNAMLNFTRYDLTETNENPTEETTESTTEETTEEPTETTTATESESEEDDGHYLIDEEITAEEIDTSQPHMQSGSTYDSNGNYVVGETDEAGNSVSYEVDDDGNTTSITDAKGNLTSYTYDSHGNVLSIVNGNSSNGYTYDDYGNLSSIAHNNFNYNYTYDAFDNILSISVGSAPLVTYTYENYDKLSRVTYGNGDYLDYTYDAYGRIVSISTVEGNDTIVLASYAYNKKGLVTRFYDGWSQQTTYYGYDCNGDSLYTYTASADSQRLVRYASDGAETVTINGTEYKINNGTDEKGDYVQYGVNSKIYSKTDAFGRRSEVSGSGYMLNYTYKNGSVVNSTTNNVASMVYYDGEDEIAGYQYNYDANGNITSVNQNNGNYYETAATYTYDSLNQLKTSYDSIHHISDSFTYDDAGNITKRVSREVQPFTGVTLSETEYDYCYTDSVWGDLLTEYDNQTISYDASGNPLSYRDGMTMNWAAGRVLQRISKDEYKYYYSYDINGLRTKKRTVAPDNSESFCYYYYDSNRNLVGMKKGADTVLYYYDTDGSVVSMSVGEDTYFFIKNLQGDITKIVDSDRDVLATYTYDAWGQILTESEDSSVEGLNPFRYRGYVYDSETGLYYLQSRYYDPKTGRFINADSPEYVDTHSGTPLSTNMFAYCDNNSVNRVDKSGKWWNIVAGIWRIVKPAVKKVVSYCLHAGDRLLTSFGVDTARIGAFFLNMEQDNNGIYHAKVDCWQRYVGYCEIYDFFFDLATSMEKVKFVFPYYSKRYVIWAWKGDYINLGAGGELGIYKEAFSLNSSDPDSSFWINDGKLKLPMSMRLIYKGKSIIRYKPKASQWWITGFNPRYKSVKASDLTLKVRINFKHQQKLFWAFYKAYKEYVSHEYKIRKQIIFYEWKQWTFNLKEYYAKLIFKKGYR